MHSPSSNTSIRRISNHRTMSMAPAVWEGSSSTRVSMPATRKSSMRRYVQVAKYLSAGRNGLRNEFNCAPHWVIIMRQGPAVLAQLNLSCGWWVTGGGCCWVSCRVGALGGGLCRPAPTSVQWLPPQLFNLPAGSLCIVYASPGNLNSRQQPPSSIKC